MLNRSIWPIWVLRERIKHTNFNGSRETLYISAHLFRLALSPLLLEPCMLVNFEELEKRRISNKLIYQSIQVLDFAVEHWFGCRATEPGFTGDIGAIEVCLIDWLICSIPGIASLSVASTEAKSMINRCAIGCAGTYSGKAKSRRSVLKHMLKVTIEWAERTVGGHSKEKG